MNSKLKIASAVAISFLSYIGASGSTSAKIPDFAFPKKVSTESLATLKKAMATDNSPLTVRSVLDYSLAQSAIGEEKIPDALALIESTNSATKDVKTKALLHLVKAKMLCELYVENKYMFDERKLPLTPLPEDYTEWSGMQFKSVISQLCDSAILPAKELQATVLSKYNSIINHDKQTPIYFPSLYDFVAYQTIGIRSKLTDFNNTLSPAYLSPARQFIAAPRFVPMSTEATKILDTYAELLKFHSGQVAPYIFADLQRLNFVEQGLYDFFDDIDSENESENNKRLRASLTVLYNDYADSEFSGDILSEYANHLDFVNSDVTKWLFSKVQHNISAYPAYNNIGCLKSIIDRLSHKSVSISHNQSIYPGHKFEVSVQNSNTGNYTLTLYRLPAQFLHQSVYRGSIANLKQVDKKSVTVDNKIPFENNSTVEFTAPEPGYYIVAVSSPEIKTSQKRDEYRVIHCSRLAAGVLRLDKPTIFVVDPMTGAPVADANIMASSSNAQLSKAGTTDKEGFLTSDNSNHTNLYYPQKGNDIYSQSVYVVDYNNTAIGSDSAITAFTELPLYHPGDTVKFAAIAYYIKGDKQKTAANKTITANLFDVNNKFVEYVTLTTDEFGRANGSFVLPENGLSGLYRMAFAFGSNKLDRYWSHSGGYITFMVSDYKLPTFEIVADKSLTDTPNKGDVTLSGKVATYSGMPLANQNVQLTIAVARNYWWRMSNAMDFYTDTVTTDANGRWKAVISSQILDNSPNPNGFFTANISSTSPSGESQQTVATFTRSAKYAISASINSEYDVNEPVNLKIKVTNSADETVNMAVRYQLCYNDSVVQQGTVEKNMDWKQLSGRMYLLKLSVEQDSTTSAEFNVTLYTPTDKSSPQRIPVWMPEQSNQIETESSTAKLLYATYAPETYLLFIVSTPEKIIEQRWIKSPQGMHTIDVKLPDNVDKVDVTVTATVNMQTNSISRTVMRKSSLKSIKIVTESFRNKIVPGTTETWSFRTVGMNNVGEQTAMIFNLYNSAINALRAPNWELNPRSSYVRELNISCPNLYGSLYTSIENQLRRSKCHETQIPKFNLYDRSFVFRRYEEILTSIKLTSRSIVNEMKMEAETTEDDAAPVMAMGVASKYAKDSGRGSNEEKATDEKEIKEAEFSYRENGVVTGVWMPSLTTDKDGNISVSFTVPNANTTWQMFASAFNKEMTNNTISKLILANKPIMVQPNLPRYLRTGDEGVIKSLVMNNSDSAASVTTVVELFNPLTDEVISTESHTIEIPSQQNGTVAIKVTAPMNQAMIGFRVKSSANGFTDGEQSIIPVLPSSQPVVETTPFYIAPDSTSFSIKLPEVTNDARVTLQYCDNPLWYVVTALPGLAESKPSSAINAAYNIFSAAVAKGILKQNPEIAQALKYWTSSECSDSTLVSMLERNADLKTVLLNATPWLTDAENDTQRMTRLAMLLDGKTIDATINAGVKYLKKIQLQDGGLAWMDQCTMPSEWSTSEVLACLGRVNQLGFIPDNKELKSIIQNALGYLQKVTQKEYAKYPNIDYFGYVAILDQWPDFKRSAKSTEITTATVQRTVKNWRKFTIGHKAEAAMMLLNHNYKSVAKTILESLREYSEYKPQKGMWWPSVGDTYGGTLAQLQITADALEAFNAAEPSSQDVDRIRQWLILQKEAENWGSSAFTTDVVSSILLTSKSWLQPAQPAEMRLNGTPVALPAADSYTGYFRTPLTAAQASGSTLTVNREGNSPAFGAVFYQFTQNMADIKAQKCDAVSIEKHYYRHESTGVVAADSMKVGDKIQVTLTIHVERDMQYVAITDNRAACLEPVEQMPQPIFSEGVCFYRENRDSSTNLFVTNLPKGTYQLSYDMWVNNAGEYASGIATLQSQYAPQLTAHSAGEIINVQE